MTSRPATTAPPATEPHRHLIRSELTKVRSTRILAVGVGLAVGLSLLIVALVAAAMAQHGSYCAAPGASCSSGALRPDPTVTLLGLMGDGSTPGLGMLVLMAVGAMVLLVEYRYGTIGTTLMVTPQRRRVAWAKAAVVAVLTAVVAFGVALASALVFTAIGGSAASRVEPLGADGLLRDLRTAAVVTAAAVFALALALLLRNAIAAVAVALLWPTLIEVLVPAFFADSGARVAGLMPFVNARRFIGMETGGDFLWSPAVSGVYFLAVVVVIFLAGTEVLSRTDHR